MCVIVELRATDDQHLVNYFNRKKTNLREGYLYVQIDIDEDQHVEYAMRVFENHMTMMTPAPKYRKELIRKYKINQSIEINWPTIVTVDRRLKWSLNSRRIICVAVWTLSEKEGQIY